MLIHSHAKKQLSIFMTFQQLSTHQATLESLLVFCFCLLPIFHHQDWSENTHCFTPAGAAVEHCLYVNSHHYLSAYLPVSSHILNSFYDLFLFLDSGLEEKRFFFFKRYFNQRINISNVIICVISHLLTILLHLTKSWFYVFLIRSNSVIFE